jgi:lipopolysaccharide/colanic/teichoic acid biosynthesis glycosyltransferase
VLLLLSLLPLPGPASTDGGPPSPVPQRQSGTNSGIFVRVLDMMLAGVALLMLSPLLMGNAVMIAVSRSGPILFRQRRIGRGGAEFTCLKFRTMHRDSNTMLADLLACCPVAHAEWAQDQKLRNDPRVGVRELHPPRQHRRTAAAVGRHHR